MHDTRRELETRLQTLHGAAYGWALTCCAGNEAEAQDVLQDAYLRLLDGRARFEGRAEFRTFVFGVIRRVAGESARKRQRRSRLLGGFRPEPALALVAAGPDPDGPSDRALRLRGALGRLSPRQRELLHLVFYEEMTIGAAAETIGVSLGTARTHYERGKARLRELLADADPREELP